MLEYYSRPPKMKPRQSISRAAIKRQRRVPGSLSWILSPKTPKVFMKSANPGYSKASNVPVPLWQTFQGMLNLPDIRSGSDSSPMSSPEKNRSPKKKQRSPSARDRYRNEMFFKKKAAKNASKHLATIEEKVLRCIMMRE